MGGLFIMLLGSMFGLPVNATLAGIFGSIVLGSIGVEAVAAKMAERQATGGPNDNPGSSSTTRRDDPEVGDGG
jgi:hypothetical protein